MLVSSHFILSLAVMLWLFTGSLYCCCCRSQDHRSGKTALMLAVETKDIRVVDLILEEVGVDGARELINIPNRAGNTAVHLAAGLRCRGREVVVQEQILSKLIKFGGEVFEWV